MPRLAPVLVGMGLRIIVSAHLSSVPYCHIEPRTPRRRKTTRRSAAPPLSSRRGWLPYDLPAACFPLVLMCIRRLSICEEERFGSEHSILVIALVADAIHLWLKAGFLTPQCRLAATGGTRAAVMDGNAKLSLLL